MANTLAPFGFDNYSGADGAPPTYGMIVAKVASNNTTKIFNGDPVKRLSTGYVAQWTASTAVSQLAGIFVSCKYFSVSQGQVVNNNFWPGADASGDVTVYLAPCLLSTAPAFKVQVSGSTQIAFADIGQNIDVALGTGNTLSGRSGATVDFATLGATATLPFVIVGLGSDILPSGVNGTDNTAVNNIVLVKANVNGVTGI